MIIIRRKFTREEFAAHRKEFREFNRKENRRLRSVLTTHTQWCRDTFLPRYEQMTTEDLVPRLYERLLIHAWCFWNPGDKKHQELLRKEFPHEGEKLTAIAVRCITKGYSQELNELVLKTLCECARKDGYTRANEYRKYGLCQETTPFYEEVELMLEVLRQRNKGAP